MKRVMLWDSNSYDTWPSWWINFTKYCNSAEVVNEWYDINEMLSQYNAKFWFDRYSQTANSPRYLDFTNEGDYLMFVLRFA